MAHGGVRFARTLVRADLVDEYHLLINPVAHGSGSPLFTEFTKLKLVDVKSFPRGNLALTYTRPDTHALRGRRREPGCDHSDARGRHRAVEVSPVPRDDR
ncbi:hypothetical protein JOD67_007005 [Tenggerimyces flavus]|nr:hypothetical protein [Tenggerimyces flavus]